MTTLSRFFYRFFPAILALLVAWPTYAAFTDNNDGTITDTVTGLTWDQCSWGLSGAGCAAGAASLHTWTQALGVAVAANGASHKGRNDWRLPSKNELESLVKIDAYAPAIDTTAFPGTMSDLYWSSTNFASNPADAWFVFFYDGSTDAYVKSSTYYVRLVRGGQLFDSFDSLVVTSYTAPSATGTGNITASFSGGGPGCGYTVSQFIPLTGHGASPPAGTAPAGVSFPHGLFDFTTGGCTPGSTITLVVTYPQALPPGTVYWKYGPTPTDGSYHWYQLPAVIAGNTATFSITDGGLGDDDLTANGTIVDQGGPGVPGGAASIPTLSEWAMLMLAGLMGLFGVSAMRRRGA